MSTSVPGDNAYIFLVAVHSSAMTGQAFSFRAIPSTTIMQSSPPISNQSRPLVEDEDVSAPSFNGLAAAEMGTVNRLDSASESPQGKCPKTLVIIGLSRVIEATTSTQGPVLKGIANRLSGCTTADEGSP